MTGCRSGKHQSLSVLAAVTNSMDEKLEGLVAEILRLDVLRTPKRTR